MRLSARKATIELAETFVISRSSQDSADVVYVEIEHDGSTGYGEAAPIERYDQSADSALDAALHHLQGKLAGQPVWRLLGLRREGPPTSWTIWLGDPDDMARRTEKIDAEHRFKRLKLKLGGEDGL